ncbi:helix-turn-helix transcriptional regulator [Pseudoxanthomonas sp. SE1]|uniref:helix-turn-helix transcriptional regulator n=1 Tax=Pseudoxanthomonas sp. SE1 TaxID=1664560 RepID=UPI00240E603E|nr:helix-turn-helix transcriptional regulator [Pseudoxanthomonas sp. SE1]WFC40822.1 helix-turn-helix transcriptional regulator [Pseudoxanthomonas sp. SE1]
MLEDNGLEKALALLYGAAAEGAPFIEAVAPIAGLLRCHMAGLHLDGTPAGSALQVSGPASGKEVERLISDYNQNWRGKNEWLQRGMRIMEAQGYSDGDDCITENDLIKLPYYLDFLAPLDIRHGVGFLLQHGFNCEKIVLSLNRSRGEGPFTPSERRSLPRLLPHLKAAYRVSQMADTNSFVRESYGKLLGGLGVGLVLLSDSQKIVHINDAAASALLLLGVSEMPLVGRYLRVKKRLVRAWISTSVTRCLATGSAVGPWVVNSSGGHRYALQIHPASRVERPACSSLVFASIRMIGAPTSYECDRLALEAGFGLSRAEACVVCSLLSTASPERTSDELGISISTVRTHIQHAFCKVGVTKQTELLLASERLLRAAARM